MAEIRFSPEAVKDLRQIKNYITEELGNAQAADNTLSDILKHIRTLARFPKSGAPLSSIADIKTDYRFLVCKSYIVFYRVAGQTAFVVRILYGRRNFMQILFGDADAPSNP